MLKNLKNIINSKVGRIIISIILGLGLASLVRKQCENNNCLEYVSPNIDEIKKNIYKFDNDCYKFESNITKCKNLKTIKVE
jgi:hypothetical protein